ncbi:MAG: aminoacyl-histidine dipeptidase [Ruminococcaceae bacterium]|nr:aminoacyl-histidine dipeptidase [Oscillospiraceae bacterium]
MLEYIKGVKNEAPFMYFEKISKIPRASHNEKAIADYLVSFARERGLFCYRDEVNNVLIVKNATQGRENEEPIMLQAHTDMVAEKNNGTAHNFETDPIELIQEGNILRANGTTLGADDGFGVAIMLAVLDNDALSHPKLECLFTSSEEVGLEGASAFDYSKIESRRMINLDSAEEDTVIIGCCGGIRTELTVPVTKESGNFSGYKITLGGLCGGHSGEDINKGRLNAHIVMGKILGKIAESDKFRISYITGGDKDNAIPRECECVIATEKELDLGWVNDFARSFLSANEDKNLYVKAEKITTSSAISQIDTGKMLDVLSVRNAVLYYRTEPPILPETSRNLARIRTNENDISIGFSSRSYLEERLDESMAELDALAKDVGGTTYHHERYPGWASDKDIPLVKNWQRSFKTVSGKDTEPTLIHAGLECGLMSRELKGLNAISVGCNVRDLHTPQEIMEIDSMDKIYDTVVDFLKN